MLRAVCKLTGSGIEGKVKITQKQGDNFVNIEAEISGLTPGEHGFHVHEFGDLTDGCQSAGAHFNPDKHEHGGPDDNIRHAGDLGNLTANAQGVATYSRKDDRISLSGDRSVIGRSLVVHADPDDLGKGGHNLSKLTGNSGSRVACGIIGLASSSE